MTTEKTVRNYGIDLLRLLSMFGIVLLHVLGDSALGAPWMSKSYLAAWSMEAAALSAVNCYALISGYVGVSAGNNPKRLLRLWSQVAFTSFVITALSGLWTAEGPTRSALLRALFPLTTGLYWYMTAYAGVLLFQPFLNAGLRHTGAREQKGFAVAVLLFFGALPLLCKAQPYGLANGYSLIWLMALYLLGGVLSQQEIPARLGRVKSALLFLGGTALALGGKLLAEHLGLWRTGTIGNGSQYMAFPSPGLVLAAIGAVCFFAQVPVRGMAQKLVACFAPAALGVYLIHIHPLVWYQFLSPMLPKLAESGGFRLVGNSLCWAAGIFLVCLLIEKARLLLFGGIQKWLGSFQKEPL